MEIDEQTGCCGIGALIDIQNTDTSKDVIKEVCMDVYQDLSTKYNLYVFTDAVKYKRGVNLSKYIIKNKLGSVVASDKRPGIHGHNVQLWVWSVDWDAMEKFAKENECYEGDEPIGGRDDPWDW